MVATIVYGNDWTVLYLDGEHSLADITLSAVDVLECVRGLIITKINERTLTDDGNQWLAENGDQQNFADIPTEMFE